MGKEEQAKDFGFDWLPGFREMTACQEDSDTGSGGTDVSEGKLLPPEQLQQEEQAYWKDYEYFLQMLPLVVREIWIVADAMLDRYEYPDSAIYVEYPDEVTMRRIADEIYEKLSHYETERTMQAVDGTAVLNQYFVEAELRGANTPLRHLIFTVLCWNIGYRRQRYLRRKKLFPGGANG